MKNKYINRAHITTRKFREILMYFCEDETASKTAKYSKINRNTVNRIFDLLRKRIVKISLESTPEMGEFEVDESYFGAKRVKGKRDRGARGNSYINGIESFWGYAKIRLVKFKGMNKDMFNLHLKECEFRFNNREQDLYKILLEMFRKEPLKLS